MTFSTASGDSNWTKPNPLDRFVSRSFITIASTIAPYREKYSLILSSAQSWGNPPTKTLSVLTFLSFPPPPPPPLSPPLPLLTAGFTSTFEPSSSCLVSSSALSAASWSSKVTKPNPLSFMTITSLTSPNLLKASFMDSSVVLEDRPPTKSFAMILLLFWSLGPVAFCFPPNA